LIGPSALVLEGLEQLASAADCARADARRLAARAHFLRLTIPRGYLTALFYFGHE
jgi:hypothetical protein